MPLAKVPARPNSEYRVGWIAALSFELTAARSMLDEIHGPPQEQDPSDSNTYCLGRIHEHNVAIACLPDYGTNAAAVAAKQMLHTFKHIRFGLMVGIGGGAPSLEHDIRLGDVVVSTPVNTSGGVVQYDMGRQIREDQITRTGSLSRPPEILLAASRTVRSNYELDDNNIPDFIRAASSKYPQLSMEYRAPGSEQDLLFEDIYDHVSQAKSSECARCDVSRLVPRSMRSSDVPSIHYGTIASGNLVMRSGTVRSKCAKELGALCFEMEAAGLMNNFACLVIRGICDYADSHKSKKWQRYAAMTAAAYAKELLLVIPADRVQLERVAQVADPELMRITKAILSVNTQQHQDTKRQVGEEKLSRCHQIFKTSDYEEYKNLNPLRVRGTCSWVLDHENYNTWMDGQSSLLWISADPGCGKSVLSRSLVDEIFTSDSFHSVCYFFFKDNETQNNLSTALCALIHQLFIQKPHLREHAIPLYNSNGQKIQQETNSLWRLLMSCASDSTSGVIICVLDALDECSELGRQLLINLLTAFHTTSTDRPSNKSGIKFLVTSRPYYDIERPFHAKTKAFPDIRLDGEENTQQIAHEIDLFTEVRLSRLCEDLELGKDTAQCLKSRLSQIPNRTYLWLHLVFEELNKSLRTTAISLLKIFDEVPESLDGVYENILNRSVNKKQARILLSIVVAAQRPLTLKEIDVAFALARQDAHSLAALDLDGEKIKSTIRNLCGLFVCVMDSRVFLLHQTAKEFLVRGTLCLEKHQQVWRSSFIETDCHFLMMEICTQNLLLQTCEGNCNIDGWNTKNEDSLSPISSHSSQRSQVNGSLSFRNGSNGSDYAFPKRFDGEDKHHSSSQAALLKYATLFWTMHFREADVPKDSECIKPILTLLNSKSLAYKHYLTMAYLGGLINNASIFSYDSLHTPVLYDEQEENPLGGIHLASYFGLHQVVQYMIDHTSTDKDQVGPSGASPLVWAVHNRHYLTAELLLRSGANANNPIDTPCCTPLELAQGHPEMVGLLVEYGADVNLHSSGTTPLIKAVELKDEEAVKFLLRNDVDVNVRLGLDVDECALSMAASHGNVTLVKLLLEAGPISKDYLNLALRTAANCNEPSRNVIARVLVEHGADDYNGALRFTLGLIGSFDGFNSFHTSNSASLARAFDMVRWSVEQGADELNDALSAAARIGACAMVIWLVERGAGDTATALNIAIHHGAMEVVGFLVQKIGNDPRDLNQALISAARIDASEVAEMLMEKGADDYSRALQSAVLVGALDTVKVLVKKGADDIAYAVQLIASKRDWNPSVAFRYARGMRIYETEEEGERSLSEMIGFLLQQGTADLDEALEMGAMRADISIIRALVKHGASDTTRALREALGEMAAHVAHDGRRNRLNRWEYDVLEKYSKTCQLLVNQGAKIGSLPAGGPGVLHAMFSGNETEALKLLSTHSFFNTRGPPKFRISLYSPVDSGSFESE